eukprot:TRINITY_DN5070_c3_g3_i1.p1 TRINITY_DN5070_c3_g3~~TRINITY_DN5070_c3_g3_i1.p1  ORF type:complete len:699 (+),score=147.86 TRINITY_DN5070_c3_g3_i1:105-2201(+)
MREGSRRPRQSKSTAPTTRRASTMAAAAAAAATAAFTATRATGALLRSGLPSAGRAWVHGYSCGSSMAALPRSVAQASEASRVASHSARSSSTRPSSATLARSSLTSPSSASSSSALATAAICAAGVLARSARRPSRRPSAAAQLAVRCRGRRAIAVTPAASSVPRWLMAPAGDSRGSSTVRASQGSEASSAVATRSPPRVRFAPSPTGVLHVGGARTALFNWLFAKSQGGEMVLRIEDTDMARSSKNSEAAILEGLRWCGITWDEGPDVGGASGPYRQSERIEAGIYQQQLERLIAQGSVYRCFLTEQELEAMRGEAERNEEAFVLSSPWATASEDAIQQKLAEEAPFVYRFRVPFDREIVVKDMVLGEVIFQTDELGGDFVIVRKSGVPMYNFSVVVDDAAMGITHVLRAQEHLMNTPRQVLIYEALGLTPPIFAHMPLILAPDRSKLSKRHGAVSVGDYRERGVLASGLVNYLAQLGWNDGTQQEIYDVDELLSCFDMEKMSKVAAIFDNEKLEWVNGHHVRRLSDERAEELIGAELVKQGVVQEASGNFVRKAATLLRDRISTLSQAGAEIRTMLTYPLDELLVSSAPELADGSFRDTARCLASDELQEILAALAADGAPEAIDRLVEAVGKARGGLKKKKLLRPLRLCLTASDKGPDLRLLFDLLSSVDANVLCDHVALPQRLELLQKWLASS